MNASTLLDRLDDAFTFDPDGCWRWARRVERGGYALMRVDGKRDGAHRVVFELLRGPISRGLTIDHLCGVRSCVNPGHMEAVTMRENTLRGRGPSSVNARKTKCPRGHAYTTTNTYRHRGKRTCRRCKAERQRAQRAA